MQVRTNVHAGQGVQIDPQQLAQGLQMGRTYAGQIDPQQLGAIAHQFGLQVNPQQLAALAQMAGGVTGPQQFLSMVSR